MSLRGLASIFLLVPACSATATAEEKPTLDFMIGQVWAKAKVTPAPVAGDAEFLRRTTLDIVGRVPTVIEAKDFLADRASDKRARLVDRLLGSEGYAEHFADIYFDLLLGRDLRIKFLMRDGSPRGWLVEAFRTNKPYDQLFREILTATGDLKENGAGAFLVAHGAKGGGPEAVAGVTARVFLGLQIQCAQCHDHPTDTRWKQEDFYGLVAYFAGTRARQQKDMGTKTFVVFDRPRGQAMMKRPGREEELPVSPRFLGREVGPRDGETRRQTLARAIVGTDLFAKAVVDRTWTQLFGRGIVEPWDDLGAEKDPTHPTLLNQLALEFEAGGFDLKALVRRIALSTAYARSSAGWDGSVETREREQTLFARAAVRPLSPEQLFRTLLVATGLEDVIKNRGGEAALQKRIERALREYVFVFGDDEMAEVNSFDGNVPQALLLLNGELTNQGTRANPAGVLGQTLASSRDPDARLRDLFLAAYGREPSAAERQKYGAHLAAHDGGERRLRVKAYEDLFFALLTSTEALTNH